MNSNLFQTYSPDRHAGWGPRIWLGMLDEAIDSRELAWRLFRRDFSVKYRQSLLGVLWVLIMPFIAVATFVFLNRSGVIAVGTTGVPYPVYALWGLTMWQVFVVGLTSCSNSLVSGGGMVVKINFPKETLVVAAMGQALFELVVRLLLIAAVLVLYQIPPKWTVIFLPFSLLPLLVFTMGLGLLLSLINMVYRDVTNMITVVTTFLMFLTPVAYPAPTKGTLKMLMSLNPLAELIAATRDLTFTGYLANPVGFLWASILAFGVFFVSWRIFHLVEFKMAEVL